MNASAREGLFVDGAGVPLVQVDSGSGELLDGTHIAYRAIAPDNAAALQRFHHRLSERSVYLRIFGAKPDEQLPGPLRKARRELVSARTG